MSLAAGALRLLRRNSRALRAKQYQLLAVTGVNTTDQEYEVAINYYGDHKPMLTPE